MDLLESEYSDFPGLRQNIDALLGVLEPWEILFMVHTFPGEFNLLEILSPQDIKNLIADIHNQWKTSEYVHPTAEDILDTNVFSMECDDTDSIDIDTYDDSIDTDDDSK